MTNPLFEESKANYAAYREEQKAAQVAGRAEAEAEFSRAMVAINKQISELKVVRRERSKVHAERELYGAKVRFANASVELLNSGLAKTDWLDSMGSRDWGRAQKILSFASVGAEPAEKAERIPAVGYVVDRAAKQVTIYPKWKPGRTGLTGPQSIAHMTAHGPLTFFVGESGQKLVSLANAEWLNSDQSDTALGERAAAERKFGNLNSAALHELGAQEFGFRVDSGA